MLEGTHTWPEEETTMFLKKKWWLDRTWADYLDLQADWYAPRAAIIDDFGSLTWAEFRDKVDRLALALIALGIKKNDRVAVQMANRHEYLICFMALSRIGAVELQVLSSHREKEVTHFLTLTEAVAWIVCLDDKKQDLRPLVNTIKSKLLFLEQVICLGDNTPDKCEDFDKIIAKTVLPENRDLWAAMRPNPSDVNLIGLTGGTTGLSKGVPRTYNDHILDAYGWTKSQQLTCNDVGLVLTPVGHNLAHACIMFPMILEGGTIVISNIPDPSETMKLIQDHKVTFCWFVPTQLIRLLESPNFGKYDLSSLRFIASGGTHVPAELVQQVNDRIGCDFINGFGMLEGPCAITRLWDTFDAKLNTVGQPVVPYNTFKIIDDDENELPAGHTGEMVAKGPSVFQGYYKTERTNIFTRDGFFRTGDLAKMDDLGRISITGRKKDVIIRGGENISSREIEEAFITHEKIEVMYAIGMPDKIMGERVCAFIELRAGFSDFTMPELRKHCEDNGLAQFMWPERIEIVTEVPHTKIGKVDRKALRDFITKKVGLQ